MEMSTAAWLLNGTEINGTTSPPSRTYQLHPSIGHLRIYVAPVLLFGGTIGNIIAFCVFCRNPLRSSATAFYFRVLSIADILVLNVGLWPSWLRSAFGIQLIERTPHYCRFATYMSYALPDISTWCLVVMSLERFIGVSFPHKVHSICTRPRIKLSVVVMVLVMLLINIPALFVGDNVVNGNCAIAPDREYLARQIWPTVDLVVYSLLPFAIMLVCNAKIIHVALGSQKHINKDGGSGITSMTVTLLTVTFAFLLLTAPFTTYSVMVHYLFEKYKFDVDWWLFYVMASYLRFLNNAVNFPLYCMSGQPFRRHLVRMFRCISDREERRRASSVANAIYYSESSRPSTGSNGIINKALMNGVGNNNLKNAKF